MALFGLKYYGKFSSKHFGIRWRVEIEQRDYDGSREQLVFDGVSPVRVTWEQRGDEFYAPVKASEATVAIVCRENFHYLPLFTADPRKYRMSILRDGALYWRGHLTADLYSESFAAPPYTVTLKATDGFSLLGSVPFYDYATYGTSGRYTLGNLLRYCLATLELDMPITDWLDLRTLNMDDDRSPLEQTYIDLERLFYVYEEPTILDVLEICLRPFAAQVFQGSGALHIRRAASLYGNARPATFYTIGANLPEGYGERPCVLRPAA